MIRWRFREVAMRGLVLLLAMGCNDYNLQGPEEQSGKYNPPDLGTERRVDEITQVTVSSVDVLWVVDNSCSMAEEQRGIRENFPNFMQYFADSGLDYHVGVVSTDMINSRQSGQLIEDGGTRYIDATVDAEEAVASFQRRADLGTNGSSDECGKDASWTAIAIEGSGVNQGFYRDEANLAVIVLSDERDYSRISVTEYVSWMQGLKPDAEQISFSSIVGPDSTTCPWTVAERGTGYIEVTEQVGGVLWPICTDDWSGLLTELGMQSAGLKREFFLSLAPVEDTIAVEVETTDGSTEDFDSGDWAYSQTRNSITFNEYVPEPLSIVRISYEVLASSSLDAGTEETEDTAAE